MSPARLLRLVRGARGLFGVLWETRFRLRGRYWHWRHETAFGRGSPSRRAMIAATLEYGEWVCQMRKLGRPAARIEGPPRRGATRYDATHRSEPPAKEQPS